MMLRNVNTGQFEVYNPIGGPRRHMTRLTICLVVGRGCLRRITSIEPSLARPGANATGFSVFEEYGTSGKWLELLKGSRPTGLSGHIGRSRPTAWLGISDSNGPARSSAKS